MGVQKAWPGGASEEAAWRQKAVSAAVISSGLLWDTASRGRGQGHSRGCLKHCSQAPLAHLGGPHGDPGCPNRHTTESHGCRSCSIQQNMAPAPHPESNIFIATPQNETDLLHFKGVSHAHGNRQDSQRKTSATYRS